MKAVLVLILCCLLYSRVLGDLDPAAQETSRADVNLKHASLEAEVESSTCDATTCEKSNESAGATPEADSDSSADHDDETVEDESDEDEKTGKDAEDMAEEKEESKVIAIDNDPTFTDIDLVKMNIKQDEGVFVLTNDNFDQAVNNTRFMLLNFYAPWCVHCKKMAPEYARAATILREKKPQVLLAKIDTTVQQALSNRFDVNKYPTLFISHRGNMTEYEGTFSAEGLVDYVSERTDPTWKAPPDATIELTTETFTPTINAAKIILVYFYAPWCGHCRRMSPEFERAARRLKDYGIPLAKVDATKEKTLAEVHEVKSYPTLLVYRKGRRFPYNGPREETGIVNHMKHLSEFPSKEVTSLKQLKKVQGTLDTTILAVLNKKKGPFHKEYEATANALRGKHLFLHTYSNDIAKHFKVPLDSLVLMHPDLLLSQYEEKYFTLSKPDATQDHMVRFVDEHLYPLVGHRTAENLWKYITKFPLVVVYYDVDFSFDNRDDTQHIRNKVLKVAQQYKGRVTFAISNEVEFEDELKHLALEDTGAEVSAGMYQSENERYRMPPTDDFKSGTLRNFVESVLQGKLKLHIRSELPPKKQNPRVLTVVGSTFHSLITSSDKDTLIMFRSPDCHMCNEIAEEVAQTALRMEWMVPGAFQAAIIDATLNDYPTTYKMDDYPAIFFVSAVDKQHPRPFTGIRKAFALIKFVKENLSTPLPEKFKLKPEEAATPTKDEL
uniref:Thioredoxin domain-containing protein n=1 Tax=Ixodes ricinus TaxID=34613 RepID=A0A0K8R8T2_IXORI